MSAGGDVPTVDRLRVDRVACTGHGICASVLPGAVVLDEWGYPVVDAGAGPLPGAAGLAAAVRLCPARALWLTRTPTGSG